jgi:uncharacterized protein VirK/YbjX
MTPIKIIAIGILVVLHFRNTGFLKILRSCLRLSHLLIFNISDFLRFAKVLMLPNVKHLVCRNPKIVLQFLSNSYLDLSLDTRSRLKIITNHYRFINKYLNEDFTKNISVGDIVLWEETIETNHYSITLSYTEYDYEGSLDLILNMNSIQIYHLSFVIVPGQIFNMTDDQVLYITRMQSVGKRFDLIKCATKALHEIHPSAMLFIAARAVASALNITSIAGITVKDQVCLGYKPVKDFTNYDNFWISMGGVMINNRVYLLQTLPEVKPLSMINQSHRRRTRIKRQIQSDIMSQLCKTFERLCLHQNCNRPVSVSGRKRGLPWTLDIMKNELRTQKGLRPARNDWWVKARPVGWLK